jgi:hypothetical protein
VGGRQGCTAALISDHEALTAAHCLRHLAGPAGSVLTIEVVFGAGEALPVARQVLAFAMLREGAAALTDDLALLQLSAPVAPDEAMPLEVVDWPAPLGASVDVVGYARDAQAPSVRPNCTAIDSRGGVTALGCDAVSGLSGGAVLLRGAADAPPRLVAIVVARSGHLPGPARSFAVTIAPRLEELRARLGD